MTSESETATYRYRAVFLLGGGWRFRGWGSQTDAIEDMGIAKEKGASATSIERKDEETGEIERAKTPEAEWVPEEDTGLKIRGAEQ